MLKFTKNLTVLGGGNSLTPHKSRYNLIDNKIMGCI